MNSKPQNYRPIILAACLFLVVDLGVLVMNFYISWNVEKDALAVNLAGRQRMLSQKMSKAVFQIFILNQEQKNFDEPKQELAQAYWLFDEVLQGFESGKIVTGGNNQPIFLYAVNEDEAKTILVQANGLWSGLKQRLDVVILKERPDSTDLKKVREYVEAINPPLLGLMNDLTFCLEQSANRTAKMLRLIQTLGIALALFNFLFIMFRLIERLKKQDSVLEQYALRLEEKIKERTAFLETEIKKRKETEMQLQTAFSEIRLLNVDRENLVRMAAHDLRNTIGTIGIGVELLEKNGTTITEDVFQRRLGILKMTTLRMRNMMIALLNHDTISSGKLQLKGESIDLKAKVEEVVQSWEEYASRKNITLATAGSSVAVYGDSVAVMEVIENLVSNAVKYSPAETEVRIEATAAGEVARLSVFNEGDGLTEDDLKMLFKPYAKLSTKPTGHEDSTGLGLSIVKKLVEAMNGSVRCESRYKQGVTFIVELPLAKS